MDISVEEKVRLDKWLWAVRFFKSRGLATEAVSGGKVHVDGARVKPSRQISVGQCIEIRKGPYEFVVHVKRLISKRVSAKEAATAYLETPESDSKRAILRQQLRDDRLAASGERLAGRPNKRERRQIHKFKSQED
ncbi:hypothetical protein AB833_11175 [Chromatiales bacterium (ex Bugula neritina AB1)]|nr:hypothetical protein AB833_11175 [Chromatiales bacterium (ex Bugula neritina AB1)]